MSKSPFISYIIPFYNGRKHLVEAVESVLNQTIQDVEIIVVDDGSPEPCSDIVAQFERVRVVKTQNHGVSGARNVGLSIALGEFVAFLDQDDVVYPSHAERLTMAMSCDPEISCAFSNVVILREGAEPKEENFATYDSALDLFKSRMTFSMGALVFRHCDLVGLGGFDLTACNLGEDWDFCLRVARFRKLVYVPEPLFGFRRHEAQASQGADRMARGALSILRKHKWFTGPGRMSRQEVKRARAGILGYWAQWYRSQLKAAGGLNLRAVRLFGRLMRHPFLVSHVLLPPLRRISQLNGRQR